jgi:hypothetical protein
MKKGEEEREERERRKRGGKEERGNSFVFPSSSSSSTLQEDGNDHWSANGIGNITLFPPAVYTALGSAVMKVDGTLYLLPAPRVFVLQNL